MGKVKKKGNQDEWEVSDPRPLLSSLLPTSIPRGLLLHISHSHTVTYVLPFALFSATAIRCSGPSQCAVSES